MTSEDYDEYRAYIRNSSDEELYLETEDQFVEISDEDSSIHYAVCVEEQRRRERRYGK